MLTSPITDTDLAPVLCAVDHLGDDATVLDGCEDFAAWCNEHRDVWMDDVDARGEVTL